MKKLELRIDRPCSEKWESFEKRGVNGFCSSCQKEVIDFTKMSDRQVKDYFLKSKGDVCGRMRKNQQKDYSLISKNSYSNYSARLLAIGSLLLSSVTVPAQKNDNIEIVESEKVNLKSNFFGIVKGVVTDDTGEALPGVNVVIKDTTTGTTTDLDGNYRIKVGNARALIFSYVGLETQEVRIGEGSSIDVTMGSTTVLMGEVVCSRYSPKGIWLSIKYFFGRIF